MGENIRLSLKGIWSHKMRSFLTMLGIIIGIAAIIAIVSTIQGTNEQIKNNLVGDGTNTVTITLQVNGYSPDFGYESVPDGVPVFNDSVKEDLLEIDNAEKVSFYRMRQGADSLYYLNNAISSCYIYGVDGDYFETAGLQIVKGRGFSVQDLSENKKVVILDKTAVSNTFGSEDPIGKTIDIKGEPYTVIGVVDKKSEFEPVINSVSDYYTYMTDQNAAMYLPDRIWPVSFIYDEPVNVLIRASSTDTMTAVGTEAASLLNGYLTVTDSTTKYVANNLADQATQLQQLSSSTNIMLIGIASISLLVGGIGVMNIMLVSVTERTREIGLKKALGARKKAILGQFLTEAAMLTVIGGILGVIAGIILSHVISALASVPVAISTPAIIVAVLFSMVIGLIFGFVPSVKASNLNPIDALRYE